MMRIGVRAHDFPKLPAEELAARISAKGMASVQLAPNKAIAGLDLKRGDLSPGLANHVGRAFRERGVGIAVLGCYVNPIHPDPAQRAELLEWFKEHIRFVRDFGCGIVALESGSLNADYSYNPENGGAAAFELLVRSISELAAEAERFGVIVGVESAASHVACTPARMRGLLDAVASPNVQAVFDPVNMLSMETCRNQQRVISECLELYGNRIVAVHAKDFTVEDGRLRSVRAGQGQLDYAPFVRFLKERKPSIDVILEGVSEETAEECARYIEGAA